MQESTYIVRQQKSRNMKIETAGNIAKALRKAKGLTQKQICDSSGISTRNLIRLEQGENVSLFTYLRVMNAIGYTLTPEKIDKPKKKL
jgi:transcriptional regulator with XRE-family HTH domain